MSIEFSPEEQLKHCDGIDIIGDVHGCAITLAQLLEKLGYKNDDSVYRHASRKAVFVGDIIDRGPRIREALHIVKNMVDHQQALCILGNHEINAVAYTTVIGKENGDDVYLRPHDRRSNRLINETLIQFASYPEEWRHFLKWFETLPLTIEHPMFRSVHACWDLPSIEQLRGYANKTHFILRDILDGFTSIDENVNCSIDRITRGTSLRFPDGRYMVSRDGIRRDFFRTKFWAKKPTHYKDVVFQPDPLPKDLNARELDDSEHRQLVVYPPDEKPVFFGHYWLQGQPERQRPNLACLDYSAVKYGRLVAYRFDGEAELDDNKFEWVYVDPDVTDR